MTTLKERLHADVVSHMKDRNKVALTTVRNVLGEIETREKSGKTPIVLDDAQVTSLLQKEAAKRRDTARIYTEAGESERAAAEIAEAEIIEAYLPKALTAAEVEAIVDEVIGAPHGRRHRTDHAPAGRGDEAGDRQGRRTLRRQGRQRDRAQPHRRSDRACPAGNPGLGRDGWAARLYPEKVGRMAVTAIKQGQFMAGRPSETLDRFPGVAEFRANVSLRSAPRTLGLELLSLPPCRTTPAIPTPARTPPQAAAVDEPAVVTWAEGGQRRTARWRSANGRPAPARVEVVTDSLTADEANRMASQGIAMLWHGDFHNARQILNALDRRVGAGKKKSR